MSSLRRPVQRSTTNSRSRCVPTVDFVSIQREISRGVRFARVLRIGERMAAESARSANGEIAISPQEENVLILTPALRRGFSADQPAY